MYIVSRKLVNFEPFESLSKRVYRAECNRMRNIAGTLGRKAKYFDESLDKSGINTDKPKKQYRI